MNATIEAKNRISSIDLLRGIVMVIMALDHVRDFFHQTAITADPLDIATASPALFFTRWITHFCAPVFVFLAGTSIYLSGLKKSKKALSAFLFKRGLWLALIEIVVMTFALSFNPAYNIIFLQVIWVTGCSMMLMALLIYLPFPVILSIGFLLFAGHNLYDSVLQPAKGSSNIFLELFVTGRANFYPLNATHTIAVFYKILPFTAIMILGYGLGAFFNPQAPTVQRKSSVLLIGVIAVIVFILVRYVNVYGDPVKWSTQDTTFHTFLSFINTTKYPPSLLYACMTIGPALILLSFIEGAQNKLALFFITFGRVPFFYYIIHFFLIHTLCLVAFYFSGYNNSQIADPNSPFYFRPAAFGYNLVTVYGIWLLVVLIMYPLCKWYGNYKWSHRQWWLSYL